MESMNTMPGTASRRAGASTGCLYPARPVEALRTFLDLGIRKFELFTNTDSELRAPYTSQLRALLDEYGAQAVSIHPYTSGFETNLFFSEYDGRTEDGLRYYTNYCAAGRALGARFLTLHGAHYMERPPAGFLQRYARNYARLARVCADGGILLTQENVAVCMSGRAEFIEALRDELHGDISFTYDIKHAARSCDPLRMLQAMRGAIVNVHFNDYLYTAGRCAVPFSGETDQHAILAELRAQGYAGDFIVEVYRDNFQSPQQIADAVRATEAAVGEEYNKG